MKRREFVFVAVTVVVMSLLTIAGDDATRKDDLYGHYETFSRIVAKVSDNYVEEVDIEKLFYGAYSGMLQTLDPHSAFLPPEDKEDLEVETQGEFGGLGIEITLDEHGTLTVVTPLEDTPAFRAGVLAGDKIIKIDGETAKGITVRDAVKKLRGPRGTPVTITVYHESGQIEDIRIVRDIIKPTSIKDPHFVDEKQKIAYVRLIAFRKRTAEELDAAIEELRKQGVRALVIDLRANPGGLLKTAVEVSDRFLSDGVIVSTRGRSIPPQVFRASKAVTYPDFPIAVLISRYSASASEILAGAIQDHQRGIIVGMRSFGKGSVQTVLPIENGKSALRLTMAYYYTPSGRLIHHNPNNPDQTEWGIDPDIEVSLTPEEEVALWDHWRQRHDEEVERMKEERENGEEAPEPETDPDVAPEPPDADEEEWIPADTDAPPEDAPAEFRDKTLEAAVNALKGMMLARERIGAAEAAE